MALPAAVDGEPPHSGLEQLWHTHTHSLPDATLYSFTVAVLFAAMHIAGLSNLLLPRTLPALFAPAKLQPCARNPLASIARAYVVTVLVYGLLITPLMLCSCPAFKLLGIRTHLPLPSLGEIVAQILAYFLIYDYTTYWLHRWYHTRWAYRTFHYMHHAYSTPDSFTSIYAHPLEVLFGSPPALVGVVLIPPHLITFWIWVAFVHLHAFEIHSGYDFSWAPTKLIPFYGGAKYHDYHHQYGAKCASNFAHGFTIFDTIYGTNKGYLHRKRDKSQVGRSIALQTHRVTDTFT